MKKYIGGLIILFLMTFGFVSNAGASKPEWRPHPMHIPSSKVSCKRVLVIADQYFGGGTITITINGVVHSAPIDDLNNTTLTVSNPDQTKGFDYTIKITAPDWETYNVSGHQDGCTPATTIPATTVPETTIPATTVPETTIPATTVPETVPATTVPETIPATTVPAVVVPVLLVEADCFEIRITAEGFGPDEKISVYDGNDVTEYPAQSMTLTRPQPTSEGYYQVTGPNGFDTGLQAILGCHDEPAVTVPEATNPEIPTATTVAPNVENPLPVAETPAEVTLPETGRNIVWIIFIAVLFVGVGLLIDVMVKRSRKTK